MATEAESMEMEEATDANADDDSESTFENNLKH